MARQARLDAEGTLHYVMVRGIERRRIVDDDRDRNNFVTRFGVIASETGMSIYAWALKKNHAHILLSSGVQGLSKFMRRLLTGYAVTYNTRHRRQGHLFQNRYKSIVYDCWGSGLTNDSAKESDSKNWRKIFRSQMPYDQFSEVG